MTEHLVVEQCFDLNRNGSRDLRLATIGPDWFVYVFDFNTGQVQNGAEFAKHSPAGIRYLFSPMTEEIARAEFSRRVALHRQGVRQ